MYPSQLVASPRSHLFNHHYFAHGRLFYRYHGSEACRFSPQAAYRLLGHLAADNAGPSTLWDPFCGTGFILSVAGFFYPHAFPTLVGTDVKPEAASCTARNLALFTQAEAFTQRLREMELLGRPNPAARQRWDEVGSYFAGLASALDFATPSLRWETAIADAASARRSERALTIFGDLPYGRASHLVGATDYRACLLPLLSAHPQARVLLIAPLAVREDFRSLGADSGREVGIRGFKGGRMGVRFSPRDVRESQAWKEPGTPTLAGDAEVVAP